MTSWGTKKKKEEPSKFNDPDSFINHTKKSVYGNFMGWFNGIFNSAKLDDYDIPKIIVIGDESTGKSSLIENLTRCQIFPRSNKFCTKMPVHLKLANHKNYFHQVTYKGKSVTCKSEQNIYKIIESYFDEVKDVTDEEIIVEIKAPWLRHFEFYDLPGVVAIPEELHKKTHAIAEKYLKMEHAIVLCTIECCKPRLTSSQALALIQKHKKMHNTILALTKVDKLMPDDFQGLLINRIVSKFRAISDEFAGIGVYNCVAIINRHGDQRNLANHQKFELNWFQEMIFGPMPAEFKQYEDEIRRNTTIKNLITQLDNLFGKFIQKNWIPKTITKAENDLKAVEKALQELGKKPEEVTINELKSAISPQLEAIWNVNLLDANSAEVKRLVAKDYNVINFPTNAMLNKAQIKSIREYKEKHLLLQNEVSNVVRDTFVKKIGNCFHSSCPLRLERFELFEKDIETRFTRFYNQTLDTFNKECSVKMGSFEYTLNGNRPSAYVSVANAVYQYRLCPSIEKLISYMGTKLNKKLIQESASYAKKRRDLNKRKDGISVGIEELKKLKQN